MSARYEQLSSKWHPMRQCDISRDATLSFSPAPGKKAAGFHRSWNARKPTGRARAATFGRSPSRSGVVSISGNWRVLGAALQPAPDPRASPRFDPARPDSVRRSAGPADGKVAARQSAIHIDPVDPTVTDPRVPPLLAESLACLACLAASREGVCASRWAAVVACDAPGNGGSDGRDIL